MKIRNLALGLLLGMLALTFSRPVLAQTPNPATKAEPRPQEFWQKRHEQFLERAKKGDVDVLFLGDSITQAWDGPGKEIFQNRFAPWKPANFGIGGDRTQHVLWRITEGKELEGISPKVVVLMIGTNNFSSDSSEQIAEGIKAILTTLHEKLPDTKVLLLGVFPRSAKPGRELGDIEAVAKADLHPKSKQVNDLIAKFQDGKKVFFLDINEKFLNEDGGLPKSIMPDFLHLTPEGYKIWADAIEKPVNRLLAQ